MTADEYIEARVDEQIAWYDQKSQRAQNHFRWLRRVEIPCAAAIPFLAGFSASHASIPLVVGLLGVVVVVLAAFQSLGQHHENWIAYRSTCESLKHEKFLFLTATAPYDGEESFPAFVERIESLISRENSVWSQHTRAAAKGSDVSAAAPREGA